MANIPDDYLEGRHGAWMQLNSGGRFFPLDPMAEEIKSADIANGLALTCRYGGQGDVDKYYSVAEHCCLMFDYARKSGATPTAQLCVLLHDASEAFAGDVIRAMKVALGNAYDEIEDNIQYEVLMKYDLAKAYKTYKPYVKDLDTRIVPLEKEALFGDRALAWAFDKYQPLGGVSIQHWSPVTAKQQFLHRLGLVCIDLDIDIEGGPLFG